MSDAIIILATMAVSGWLLAAFCWHRWWLALRRERELHDALDLAAKGQSQ